MKRIEIDLKTFDELFDSGEVDMDPYLDPSTAFRPFLEDPPTSRMGDWLGAGLDDYRGENARWVKPGRIRDFAQAVRRKRGISRVQRTLATHLLSRVGITPAAKALAEKALGNPRSADTTRKLAQMVLEHAKDSYNPDFGDFGYSLVSDEEDALRQELTRRDLVAEPGS